MHESEQLNAAPDDEQAKMQRLAAKLAEQWREARDWFNGETREKAIEARRFYDGEQWTPQQVAELEEQGRPAIVINQVAKAINNLSGRQRDSRLSYRALPRSADDVLKAAGATRALGYIEYANQAKFTESAVVLDALKGPLGWVEVGVDESDPDREEVFLRYVPPFEMVFDPFGRSRDLSDFRYLVRHKEVDLDVAISNYPEHEAIIRAAANESERGDSPINQGGDYGNRETGSGFGGPTGKGKRRDRVTLREHHYWAMEACEYVKMPNGDKFDADPDDPMALAALMLQGGQVVSGRRKRFYEAVMVGERILSHDRSPYPFARFRYVAAWAYQARDGRPHGVIEPMIWPQKELNVARSRLNESIRSRGLIVGEGALGKASLADVARELSKANFAIKVANPAGVQIVTDQANVTAYANLMETSRAEIDDVGGQNEAAYGDKSNEKSGAAIQARVSQQGLNLGEVFDNWRHFRLLAGQMLLALALKYWSPGKWARIIEMSVLQEQQAATSAALSRGEMPGEMPGLEWIQDAAAGISSLLRLDLKLEDQAETTTERQASMDQAVQLVGMLPDQAKAAILPGVIRMSDFAGAEEMAVKAEQALMPPTPETVQLPPGEQMMPPGF